MKKSLQFAVAFIVIWLAGSMMKIHADAVSSPAYFQLVSRSASAEDIVEFKVGFKHSVQVAGFRLRISYDTSSIKFIGAETSAQIENGTMQTNSGADPVCSVYVCNVEKGHAPSLSGNVATYIFQVKDGAPAGETDICAYIDETCDYAGKDMGLDYYETFPLQIKKAKASTARLIALEPLEGSLQPAFSPDIHSYRLSVEPYIQSVTFRANAVDGAKVQVSRKSLYAAGSSTPILVTVTSADGTNRAFYSVTVNRESKSQASDPFESMQKKIKTFSSGKSKNTAARETLEKAGERALSAAKNGRSAKTVSGTDMAGNQQNNVDTSISAGDTLHKGKMQTSNTNGQPAALNISGNSMPLYLVGMLAAGFCIVIGILLCIWFSKRKK